MLRQYQTGLPRAGGTAGGASSLVCGQAGDPGGWGKGGLDSLAISALARPMSAKILAVGVALVGVLVLSVALIMGLEFPKYVHVQLREDQCLVHDRHPKFASWRDGSQWRRQVRAFYYQLLNPEQFLYQAAKPQFSEKGPYIYTEYETREDVKFSVTEVTYRLSRRHVFNGPETLNECPSCQENDSLTLLNADYLRNVYKTGGYTNYLLSILPSTLRSILHLQGFLLEQSFSTNISALGCLGSNCDNSLLDFVARVSFGTWLRTSSSNYSSVILESRTSASFNDSEVGGLYGAVTNSSVLGSGVFSSSSTEPDSVHSLCQMWALHVCDGLQLPVSLTSFDPSVCGLVHILEACKPQSVQESVVRDMFTSAFCPVHKSDWCLDLNSSTVLVLSAYFEAIQDFVFNHLLYVIQDFVILQTKNDLVVTRTQSDLALGYHIEGNANRSDVHVEGLLSEDWLKNSRREGTLWKMSTCLQDRNLNNNMRVREFNGSQYAPPSLLRDGSGPVRISGASDFLPACSPKACVSCAAPGSTALVFEPSLFRALRYSGVESTTVWDSPVYRYWLSQDAFTWSNLYDVSCGLQRMTSWLGFVGWISLPGLEEDLLDTVWQGKRNCSIPKPQSFIDVEPVTGRVWQRRTQLQLNAGIRAADVTGPRLRELNVGYLDRPAPVLWTERRVELSSSEVDFYDYKVDRLLKVACGGLIGLSIVAVIVVAIGIAILFLPKKLNRVMPAHEGESSAANLHTRHHIPT